MKAAGNGTDGGDGTYAALGFGAFGAGAFAALPAALAGGLESPDGLVGAGRAPQAVHAGVAGPSGEFHASGAIHAFGEAPSLPAAREYPPMPPAMQVMGAHEIAQGHLAFDF